MAFRSSGPLCPDEHALSDWGLSNYLEQKAVQDGYAAHSKISMQSCTPGSSAQMPQTR